MKIKDILQIFDQADAFMILDYLFSYTRTEVILNMNKDLRAEDIDKVKKIKILYDKNIPIEYILGFKYFYGRKFFTDKNVLIPRFDTEILVDEIVNMDKDIKKGLEIGVGSGIIAISLSLEKNIDFMGVDINEDALKLSRKNADSLSCDRVKFIKSDIYENVEGKFDIIVSNPPYINYEDMKTLDQKVLKEPKLALYGGEDGLYFYREIIKGSGAYLNQDGILAFEIGYDQKEAIFEILDGYGYKKHYCRKDFNGFDRVIIARR